MGNSSMGRLKDKVAIVTGASEGQAWNEAQTPLGGIGQVQDIAPIVAFLASDDAGWVTGEVILGAGGMR